MFENNTDDLILEKLTVLYALNNISDDLTDSQLTQIILGTNVMNYFTLMTLLPKMIESKFITTHKKNDSTFYTITQNGLEVLIYFKNRIPDYFKEKIDEYIKENREELLSHKISYKSNYTRKDENSYIVTLIAIKGGENVMSLSLIADSEEKALNLCHNWNNSIDDKYSLILDVLSD